MKIFYKIRLTARLYEKYDDFSAHWSGEKFDERTDPFYTENKTDAMEEFKKALSSVNEGDYLDSYKIELVKEECNEEGDLNIKVIKTVYGKYYIK